MIRALFTIKENGLVFSIRVSAKAKKNSIGGIIKDSDSKLRLKIYTTSAPQNGKANVAILKLLSSAWNLSNKQIAIIHGLRQRDKILFLKGDPSTLLSHLDSIDIVYICGIRE